MEIANELSKKRLLEINNQIKTLKERTVDSKKHPHLPLNIYEDFEKALQKYENETSEFLASTMQFKKTFTEAINKRIDEMQKNNLPDIILETVQQNFIIGKEFSYSKMIEISKYGDFRYGEQIPPGYMDEKNKIGLQKYGDLYAWMQILDYAYAQRKDFILVTNDVKNDWFEDDKITPRFELLKEFNEKANKSIWLLSMKKFLWEINSLLDDQLNDTIFEDIDSIEKDKEKSILNPITVNEMLQDIFRNILCEDIYLIDTVPRNEAIRLFNNPYLFEAENEEGEKYRIVGTFIESGIYTKMLHGMTNAFEIKKFYDSNNEHYQYYNFIITKNKEILEKCLEHLKKNRVKKMFQDKSIRTVIGFIEDEKFFIMQTNFSVG